MRIVSAALLLLSLALAPAGASELDLRLPDIGDPASRVLSPTSEQQLGDEIMQELRNQLPLVEDAEVRAYIEDLGARLASYSNRATYGFEFFVVDAPAINAFALPGGYIGVNSGLILAAENESELAGVMAHEIAHVTQRHIARRMAAASRLNVRSIAMVLAGILIGTQDAQAGQAAIMAGTAGTIQQQLNYSRAHEQEADRVGLKLLADAGYDPHGMPNFFGRLMDAARYAGRPPEYLSTHPMTQSRIADTAARAEGFATEDARESASFSLIRSKLLTLEEPPEQAAGIFRAALKKEGGDAAHYGLALVLTNTGRYDEAREQLDAISAALSEHPTVLAARARLERRAGHPEHAEQLYRDGLSLYPGHLPLQLELGELLLSTGQADRAYALLASEARRSNSTALQRLYAQAARAANHPIEARLAMADYYRLQGDWHAALTQLDQVLEAQPTPHQAARASARQAEIKQALQDAYSGR